MRLKQLYNEEILTRECQISIEKWIHRIKKHRTSTSSKLNTDEEY